MLCCLETIDYIIKVRRLKIELGTLQLENKVPTI
jgi:hypothetical protein|tara:strand:- start:196 stop:297 length:102 start_codon:yes stop_codon:yes gene_type:complete